MFAQAIRSTTAVIEKSIVSGTFASPCIVLCPRAPDSSTTRLALKRTIVGSLIPFCNGASTSARSGAITASSPAFATATSFEPEILRMDEWIGAGDASFQDKAKRRMDELAEKAGIIVLASHNEGLIKRVCNRMLTLENSRITSDTPMHEAVAKDA